MRADAVDAAVAQCRALGARAEGYLVDVTDREAVDAMVAKVRETFGRIDVLVNNAGITKDARLQKMTLEQFDAVIDVNLRGVFHCAQAVADVMVAQGSGVILNASSVVGIYGNFGQTNYAASKFGVIGFTKTWSRELGPQGHPRQRGGARLRRDAHPGDHPRQGAAAHARAGAAAPPGQAEEIANVYAFLASDEASYVNGAVIEVRPSGGMTV
jgi:3-oxoacyl-[acyl-carrier protein] reductase